MNIIVTGASGGIGFELVKALCFNTEHYVIAIVRNISNIDTEYRHHPRISWIEQDLNADSYDVVSQFLEKQNIGIDILINNAGYLFKSEFKNIDVDKWENSFKINVISAALITQIALPYLLKSSTKHIVNISSMSGVSGAVKFPNMTAYAASKAALIGLTEALAVELEPMRVTVNCLALGAVQTHMLQEAFPDYTGGILASEAATFIADFAQNGYKYFNGKTIPVSKSTP
ncbi:MAG: SDR family oxidoreductase [Cytophagales bacterium]